MTVVTVSSKYQVVIPKDVREQTGIRPGQKVEAFAAHERRSLSSAVEVLLIKALAFEKLASAKPTAQ